MQCYLIFGFKILGQITYILIVESTLYNITYKLKKNRSSVLLVQETFKEADIFPLLDFLRFHFK